jgi:membrane fusion protein (multidrug efflux system)
MLKKFIIALCGFAILVFGLGAVKVAQIKAMSSQMHTMPAAAVTSAEAKVENWRPVLSAIGTITPIEGVSVAADADGTLQHIAVENGAAVKAGDVLMQLDTSVELAQLKASQAQLELARLEANRAGELLKKNTISQAQSDQATAQLDQAEANVAALKATINKKTIRAPFDGRVGIRQVNLGQFISRGMPLVSLQKLNPLYVNFNVPQRQIPHLRVGDEIAINVDAFGDRKFPAKISAINAEVDSTTRNIVVQGLVENQAEELRPGMFARVEVQLPQNADVVVLPATAIAYAPYGNSVFVIEKMKDPEGKEYLGVRQQFVKLGDRRGDLVAITEGVKAGEQVVSAGVFKLRNGLAVQVNNTVQPTADPAPKPANT